MSYDFDSYLYFGCYQDPTILVVAGQVFELERGRDQPVRVDL